MGKKISVKVPEPLELSLDPLNPVASDNGPEMPVCFIGNFPVLREDLIETMRASGVDNLDTYDVIITDPDTGNRYNNYRAVNIIGVVAAADMNRSVATVHPGGPVIDVDFDNLVIDETKTHGLLIFRLAESTNAILVHETLRDALLRAGFTKLEFLDPSQCAL